MTDRHRAIELRAFLNPINRTSPTLVLLAHHQEASAATHQSVAELRADIEDWVQHWNAGARPFIW